jgi:hypothetical protein
VIDYLKAIDKRCSRRAYIPEGLDKEIATKLHTFAKKYSTLSELNILLIENDHRIFDGFFASYGMFSGVENYIALIGSKSDKYSHEKAGYYGEKLILDATLLNLGTCWIGGTYKKDFCKKLLGLSADDELICVIVVGKVKEQKSFKEKLINSLVHRSTKPIKQMYTTDGIVPDWFIRGMRAVQKAPSAINKQPVKFMFQEGMVSATVPGEKSHNSIDLGIAMLHFEIGAYFGKRFELINGSYKLKF